MERKIMQKLIAWKNKGTHRLPLLLYGARQVGKTYALNAFAASEYADSVYINFEQMVQAREIFSGDLLPDQLILHLERYTRKKIIPEQTLLIFDEIQACDRALTSLKYFAEQATEYHIIAAGSLLGVALAREQYSFPVGKVDILTLFPLDFEEFLMALDEKSLAKEIRFAFENNTALLQYRHEQALHLYHHYLLIGGMPASVAEFCRTRNLTEVKATQSNILNAYVADMAKYASPAESVKIRASYDSIPMQLAKENTKFQYKVVKKGANSSTFGVALDWLAAAGVIQKCKRLSHANVPLEGYVDLSAFKIYMSDIGLLSFKTGLDEADLLLPGANLREYKGGFVENYVAQALISAGFDLYYWESDGRAEIDFVIRRNGQIVPVEVKASTNTRSRSLSVFVERYKPESALRISEKNFGLEGNPKSIPLYSVFALSQR